MDRFEQYMTNFLKKLEACSTEQWSISAEFIESFNTFTEEKLLTFTFKIGQKDTTNVQQLLFEDLLDLSRHLQPKLEERLKLFLESLQDANEDRLYRLHRRTSVLVPSSMVVTVEESLGWKMKITVEEALGWKMKEQEKKDLTEFLYLTSMIIEKISACVPGDLSLIQLREKMKEHRGTFDCKEETLTVDEINKRNLGKMIVRYVGHEGMEEKLGLRSLLQYCIDFLQTHSPKFWKDASITIYDEDDNMYKIASGKMKHQFICQMTDGEPCISDKNTSTMHTKIQNSHKNRCIIS